MQVSTMHATLAHPHDARSHVKKKCAPCKNSVDPLRVQANEGV
jgi:hypothetical protein